MDPVTLALAKAYANAVAAGIEAHAWLSGAGAPAGALGEIGDYYLDTANGDVHEKTGATAWTLRANIMGPEGAQGPRTIWLAGDATARGETTGEVGDQWLDTDTGDVYEWQSGELGWVATGANLTGPGGPPGADGPPGDDGRTILNGEGAPSDAEDGVDGDFYVDTVARTIYGPKTAGAWGEPHDLRGPEGAPGAAGLDGVDGQNVGSYVISGGQVAYVGSGLDFRVSRCEYVIRGEHYETAEQTITVTEALGHSRIDVIAVNSEGNVERISGVPAEIPQRPNVDPLHQLTLTFLLVPGDESTPGITREVVYEDNDEWAASGVNVAVDASTAPRSGTYHVRCDGSSADASVTFAAPPSTTLANATLLVFYLKPLATWGWFRGLRVWFRDDAGNRVGRAVSITNRSYGFSTSSHVYQQVAVPVAAFAIAGATEVTDVRFQVAGVGAAIGFDLDDVSLEYGGASAGAGGAVGPATFDTAGVVRTAETVEDPLVPVVNAAGRVLQALAASDETLVAWAEAEAYEATAITRDSDGVPTEAVVKWPDGSAGTFTLVTKNTGLLAVDAYTVSHTDSGKTVTQAAVTRDALGNITTKPALTVA